MNDNETVADIIAWLRRPREGENAYLTLWRDEIADRLDAAHKRELAVYVLAIVKLRGALVKCRDIALLWQADEAAGVAGTTDKPHARSAAEAVIDIEFEINAALFATATAEKSSTVVNAAKLREAMTTIQKLIKLHGDNEPQFALTLITEVVCAALAAPARNCDMPLVVDGPADNNADKVWIVFKRHNPDAYFDVPGLLRCIDWLLGHATEKEGGAK